MCEGLDSHFRGKFDDMEAFAIYLCHASRISCHGRGRRSRVAYKTLALLDACFVQEESDDATRAVISPVARQLNRRDKSRRSVSCETADIRLILSGILGQFIYRTVAPFSGLDLVANEARVFAFIPDFLAIEDAQRRQCPHLSLIVCPAPTQSDIEPIGPFWGRSRKIDRPGSF